jgi:hypothetical protein
MHPHCLHTVHACSDEDNLLVLINSARTADQVKAALHMLRWDKMVRARQQQRYSHYTSKATRALLRVRRMLGAGSRAENRHDGGESLALQDVPTQRHPGLGLLGAGKAQGMCALCGSWAAWQVDQDRSCWVLQQERSQYVSGLKA